MFTATRHVNHLLVTTSDHISLGVPGNLTIGWNIKLYRHNCGYLENLAHNVLGQCLTRWIW